MKGAGRPTSPIRAFLAFEIPPTVKQQLERSMTRLRRQLPPARWVRPEGLHLTVKFLGESEPERLDGLVRALDPELAALSPVTFTLGGTGFFPSAARARVAWIGGTDANMDRVVSAVERAAVRGGWPPERRRWSLHLTLARLGAPWPRQAATRFLQWGESLAFEPFQCPALILFSSVLRPSGAVYSRLAALSLGGIETSDGRGGGPA